MLEDHLTTLFICKKLSKLLVQYICLQDNWTGTLHHALNFMIS